MQGGGGEVGEKKEKIVVLSFSFSRACFALVPVEKKKRKTSAYRIMLRLLFSVILWHGMAKCVKQIAVFVATKENGLHLPNT